MVVTLSGTSREAAVISAAVGSEQKAPSPIVSSPSGKLIAFRTVDAKA